MEIRTATNSDINSIYEFNSRMYPNKKIDSRQYIDFWLSKCPDSIKNILLLTDDDNKIVGQIIMTPMSYYYQKEVFNAVWEFDLIVEEQYQKDAWGLDLMMRNKELFPNTYGTGSNPLAQKINLKLGMKMLGEIKKYVGITNPLWFINVIGNKNIPSKNYPKKIKVREHSFILSDKYHLASLSHPFNNHLLEFERDKKFLQWRFFNNLHDYTIYTDQNSNNYFVLRTTIIKHIKVMLLVDYRCNSQTPEEFENILCAAKRITSKLHLPILITGSTLNTFDNVLEKHHFKSIGRPRPVLGYIKCKDRKDDIENRNFIFATLADSDGETNWI